MEWKEKTKRRRLLGWESEIGLPPWNGFVNEVKPNMKLYFKVHTFISYRSIHAVTEPEFFNSGGTNI
jgi:hypothetical protein